MVASTKVLMNKMDHLKANSSMKRNRLGSRLGVLLIAWYFPTYNEIYAGYVPQYMAWHGNEQL